MVEAYLDEMQRRIDAILKRVDEVKNSSLKLRKY